MKKSISLTLLSLSLLACATPMQTQQNTPPTGSSSVTTPPDTDTNSSPTKSSEPNSITNESPVPESSSSPITSTPETSASPSPSPSPSPTKTPEPEEDKNRFTARWVAMAPIGATKFTTDISFVDFYTGWAVGSEGIIKKTTDAGKTWTDQSYGGTDINSVSFVNKNIGFIANKKGMLYQTTNGGDKWQPIETPLTYSIDYVNFFDENHGVIYGFGSNRNEFGLHITQDGGKTWKHIHPTAPGTSYFKFITPENGILYTIGGSYAKTFIHDTFSPDLFTNPDHRAQGIAFKNAQEGYIFGFGVLMKTMDGGETWDNVPYITTQTEAIEASKIWIYGLSFANESQGVMVIPDPKNSYRKVTLSTSDGGETWTEAPEKYLTQNQDYVYGIVHMKLFDDFNHGWALLGDQSGIKVARLGSP